MTTTPSNRSLLSKVGRVVTGLALTSATCFASVALGAPVVHASVATQITPDADTVVLDHFDGTSAGAVYGPLGYADSLDGLGQAGVFGEGIYTKYNVSAIGSAQGTVEMWVKPAGAPTSYINLLNFNWNNVGSYPPAGHVMHWKLQPDAVQVGVFWGWSTDGSNGAVGTTPVCATGDCWTHIAFSWGPAGSKIYVNGQLDGHDPRPSGPASPQWAYLNYWGGPGHFDGLVDEFQVSKVQRADAEILAHATLSDPTPPDTTPPSVAFTTPVDGGSYLLGSTVTADYTCTDDVSVATCTAPVANGSVIDTSSVGTKQFTVTAVDSSGNTTTVTHTYTIRYGFVGFEPPVTTGTPNVAKAGQTIPLKFKITDHAGSPVTDLTDVAVTSVTCGPGAPGDQTEEHSSGGSGLQNLGDGRYQFNWKTPKTYAGSCKTMQLRLGEGGTQTAEFHFTR